MKVLLIADGDATGRALTAALKLGDVDILEPTLPVVPESLADAIVSLASAYDVIAAPSTSTAKSVLPRVAALLDVMQISDVIEVLSADTFRRPTYAGNAIETVQSSDAKKVLTIRASAFDLTSTDGVPRVAADVAESPLARVVAEMEAKSDRPQLTSAKIVVSGGRAFGSKAKFDELLLPLALKLNAAVGATRAAVDADYAANDLQVGQTGQIVAPDLYIACGISGAIQHLAGMKDSKVIVAINSDPNAPIFAVADYGLVGDVFTLIPELTKAL